MHISKLFAVVITTAVMLGAQPCNAAESPDTAVAALFSASLRSPNCVFPEEARNFKFEIPFKFELTDGPSGWRR